MHLSPVKAIKKHCLDCSGGSKKEVRECIIQDCPLYPFRLGKNPNRKGLRLKTTPSQEWLRQKASAS